MNLRTSERHDVRRPSLVFVLAIPVFLMMLVLAGCGQENPPAERQEQRGAADEGETKRDTSPATTIMEVDTKGVGGTTEVGPFLVRLNDVEARLSDEGGKDRHHYAVVDLTLESRARE